MNKIITGAAASRHFRNGVLASIQEWGGSVADANAYYALPAVNYLTAKGTYKQKIGLQAWIALNNRGMMPGRNEEDWIIPHCLY